MTTKMDKLEFAVKITYFKPNGKYYTDHTFKREFRAVESGICYMPDVTAHIRGLRDNGGQGALPGLSDKTEGWEGFILVDCEEGYPCLILPGK